MKPYEGLFLMQSSWLSHIKQYIYQRIYAGKIEIDANERAVIE